MKWFKHLTGSLNNSFIFELIEKFGGDGYLVYFGTLEIMSDEFDIFNPGVNRIQIKKLTKNFQLSRQKTLKILTFCDEKANENLLKDVSFFVTIEKTQVIIKCKKLAKLCDNHTQKLLKDTLKSLQSDDEVTSSLEAEAEVRSKKQLPPSGDHFKNKMGDYLDVILDEIKLINKYPQNGKLLNPKILFQWIQEKSNKRGHPKAIYKSLNWLKTCLEKGEAINSFRAFAEKTFITVNPKYNSRDAEAESEAFKNAVVENEQIKKLLEGIGL